MKFKDDFTVDEDGSVKGLPAVMYEYGDRYVKCRRCEVSRPAHELLIRSGVPICKDHERTRKEASESPRSMPEVRQLQVAVHMPSQSARSFVDATDAPVCQNCGDITVRSGSCHKCMNCGSTTGCS